jgi:hypothetical protein
LHRHDRDALDILAMYLAQGLSARTAAYLVPQALEKFAQAMREHEQRSTISPPPSAWQRMKQRLTCWRRSS